MQHLDAEVAVRTDRRHFKSGTGDYAVDGDEIRLGDDPPARYCVDGDALVMDYYEFHPVSWRY